MVYGNSGSQIDASHHQTGQLRKIQKGIYKSWEGLVQEIIRVAHLTQFDYKFDFITDKLIFTFSYQGEEIPSILGFKAKPDPTSEGFFHISYRSAKLNNRHTGDFPFDITCGSQLIFIYIDLIGYQHVGDSRAPVLKIIESERRERNGSLDTVTPVHHKSYTNLDLKKLLSNDIQSIKIELRTKIGNSLLLVGLARLSLVSSSRKSTR